MKRSILFKFTVMILTALSMVIAIGGIVGIVAMEDADMFVNGPDSLQDQQYRAIAETLAEAYIGKHVTKEMETCPDALIRHLYDNVLNRFDRNSWGLHLNLDKQVIAQTQIPANWTKKIELTIESEYPIAELYLSSAPEEPETEPPQQAEPETSVPETVPEETLPDGWLYNSVATVWEQGEMSMYRLYYYPGPTYTVTVYLQEEILENSALHLLTGLYPHRYDFIWMLSVGLIGFAAGFAFLMYAAGHAHDDTIRPGGLNRIPLDLYFLMTALGVFLLIWLFTSLRKWMIADGPHPGNLSLLGATLFAITLLVIGFFFALAAQTKLKNGFWWKHSILGFCLQKLFKGLGFAGKGIYNLARLLPLVWQWLIAFLALLTATAISLAFFLRNPSFVIFLFLLPSAAGTLALIGYGAYAFGLLHQGAKQMTAGNLEKKIPTKYLFGCFRSFAEELNALSETAVIAAQNQTRSERMKSELITNVSHDIKTPLTSIINFVDLLQKPHTPEQNTQYLEILRRQSYQMKRLIEDLIELSKANTGNITVNLAQLDAAETVNQALGEFSDKLDAAGLTPVFRQPEDPVFIQADGRLLWRVMSNLLTNAIKYAMPGTRLYLDLVQEDSTVALSMKNVSKEELRHTSEQLMERFSQGDVSRQSGGSGLGLNIAQSLMEVQGGSLELELDGDLFKVTVRFPEAQCS